MKYKLRWTTSRKTFLLWAIVLTLAWAVRSVEIYVRKQQTQIALSWDLAYTRKLDSLNQLEMEKLLKPFNPNYFTAYRAYVLDLSDSAFSRLQRFRARDKYVNTAEEFQRVTQVDSQWLAANRRWFVFPQWVQNSNSGWANSKTPLTVRMLGDLNQVTVEDLQEIRGIGPALSKRIVDYRTRLGGFVDFVQLEEVYGLKPEVIANLKKQTRLTDPKVAKIAINQVGLRELIKHPYFDYSCAKELLVKRTMEGKLLNVENLDGICAFSANKLKIIGLYLEF